MDFFLIVFGGLAFFFLLMFFFPLFLGLIGMFSGWIFGYWFPAEANMLLSYAHFPGTIGQFGVILGFVSGFFKQYQSTTTKDKGVGKKLSLDKSLKA